MNMIMVRAGNENRTPEITELLRRCSDDTEIVFERGVYNFYTEGCYTGYFCPV